MKRLSIVPMFFLILVISCNAQKDVNVFNLDFESIQKDELLPSGWIRWGTADYSISIDSTDVFSGEHSVLISSTPASAEKSFGSIAYQLPTNFIAQNITLTGYIKTEDVKEGFAGLLLRIDGKERSLAFDNMQKQNIRGTIDWTQYEITLPFSREAQRIFVAGILTGKGKAWFDKFEISFDDKDISLATQITKESPKAELDKEFDNGSNLIIENITKFQLENLYKVGKVWGFLKYYHPQIAAGNFNWDYELIRMLHKVLDQTDTDSVNALLINQIDELGDITLSDVAEENKDIKLNPPIQWINDTTLFGSKLSSKLNDIRDSQKSIEHYYVSLTPNVGNPIFTNENSYTNMNFDDDGIKIIGLFRYWNIIQYYFPYRNLIDENWDSVLMEFIPKIISADDELSYKLTLLELIGKVSDTHANIWQRDDVLENFRGLKAPPVEVIILDNEVVVSRLLNVPDKNIELQIGDIITMVDDVPVAELISDKIRYCPASNLPTKYRDVARKLLRTNDNSIKLTVKRGASSFNVDMKCSDYDPSIYYKNDIASHKIIKNNIGYIYPGSLEKGEIDSIMSKFQNTEGLIIDLRCYPSDFIVFSLGKYLMPRPTDFVKFTIGSLLNPGEFSYKYTLKVGESREDFYKNKVIILVNEKTQSQAEYTTMALRVAPKAQVLGSTTAGADGNVSTIVLPGNVRTLISGIGVYYPDGTETQRVGIIPDIEIRPTINGIRNEEDELLNKAIEIIKQK